MRTKVRTRGKRGRGAMARRYSALDIAKFFIWRADQDKERLTNLKLQKLLYYAQGLHLALGFGPLFADEIRGWSYGPVVPIVYHEYKHYKARGIAPDRDFSADTIDPDTREYLEEIYLGFAQFSAFRLLQLSHSDQCWIDSKNDRLISHKAMIETMKKYLKNG